MVLIQLVILCLTGIIVWGYPQGAPPDSCFHMLPGHIRKSDGRPLRPIDSSKYEVKAEIDGKYVRVSIKGRTEVKGFLIQARQTENGPAIGKFKLPSQSNGSIAKYLDCTDEKYQHAKFSSITHTNRDGKSNLTFLWSPIEMNQNISINFYATLVENYETFWVKQPSNEINLMDISDSSTTPSTATQGQQFIPFWTLSTMAVTFMMNLLTH